MLETIEIETAQPVTNSVIWLHGLGADGHDFESIVPALNLPPALGVRFIFPHAPIRPVTLNNGLSMRAWFDIYALSLEAKEDAAGIDEAQQAIAALIQRENERGIQSEHIFLAGFSQGGAVALWTGLGYPERLGGIMALSTFLPLRDQLEKQRTAANQQLPIFMGHGMMDPVLPLMLGQYSYQRLLQAGCAIEWHTYPMLHQVCEQEISDISHWLVKNID